MLNPVVLSTGKIQDADIARIAGELPLWQIVAKYFSMGPMVIEEIETNNGRPADQRMEFLRKWIKRDGSAATYEKLSEAMEKLGHQGAAERIREIAQQRFPFQG